MPLSEMSDISYSCSLLEDPEMLQCFLNFPELDKDTVFALDYAAISTAQQSDERLQKLLKSHPQEYAPKVFSESGPQVICYMPSKDRLKICIPDSKVDNIVQFYHYALVHPGKERMLGTIQMHFENPKFKGAVEHMVAQCDPCQKCKAVGKGYGKLPPRIPIVVPWYEVAVDLIGPWKLRDADGKLHEFTAITIIDTVTGLCEMALLHNKTAQAQDFLEVLAKELFALIVNTLHWLWIA